MRFFVLLLLLLLPLTSNVSAFSSLRSLHPIKSIDHSDRSACPLSTSLRSPRCKLRASARNWGRGVVWMGSGAAFEYTHLEINSQLWKFKDSDEEVSICVDPLVGQLDFGLPPSVYCAKQKVLKDAQTTLQRIVGEKPRIILITQSLDDHTHPPTLSALRRMLPMDSYTIIAPPSAKNKLAQIFPERILKILKPGETSCVGGVEFTATSGSLVGPPWQDPENGYIASWRGFSVYYEPHNDVDVQQKLRGRKADVVIAPVVEQALPLFTLVHGAQRAIDLASYMGASNLIPLRNGDVDSSGFASSLVQESGSVQEAIKIARGVRVLDNSPGEPVQIDIDQADRTTGPACLRD
eukprot:746853-Hanusia_phi.AAC.2